MCRICKEKCQNGGCIHSILLAHSSPPPISQVYVFSYKENVKNANTWTLNITVKCNNEREKVRMKENKICFTQNDFVCAFEISGSWMLGNFSNWLAWRPYMFTQNSTNNVWAWDEETCSQCAWDGEWIEWASKGELSEPGKIWICVCAALCCDSIYVKNVKHSHAWDMPSNGNNPLWQFRDWAAPTDNFRDV